MRSSLPNVPMMGRGNNSTMAVCHLAELLKFINKAAWESHSEWDTAQWFASWESLRTCSTMTSLKWADVFHASGVVSGSLGWDPTYKLSLVFNRVHESIPNTNYNSDSHEMSIELDAQNCNVVGEKSGLKHTCEIPHIGWIWTELQNGHFLGPCGCGWEGGPPRMSLEQGKLMIIYWNLRYPIFNQTHVMSHFSTADLWICAQGQYQKKMAPYLQKWFWAPSDHFSWSLRKMDWTGLDFGKPKTRPTSSGWTSGSPRLTKA